MCVCVEGEKDLRSLAVPPNGTYGYVWKLTAEDGPLEGDPQCLTRLYQSTINPERDLATGLVGPLLICKKDSMDTRGRLVRLATSYVHNDTRVVFSDTD